MFGDGIPGVLNIGTGGCSNETYLIVKGPTYGRIWTSYETSHLNSRPTDFTFTEWICDWADRCIPLVIQERVANPVKEGMKLQEVIAICGGQGNRSYSRQKWGGALYHVHFDGLRTAFELDENDTVVRIIRHSI